MLSIISLPQYQSPPDIKGQGTGTEQEGLPGHPGLSRRAFQQGYGLTEA